MSDRAVQRLRLLRGSRRLTDPDGGVPALTYADTVAALTRRGRFGISLGLDRVSRLMARLDHPGRNLRGALVGGTNGKGSVVAMVCAVLVESGLRVGTMPKPHLVSYRERIAVDGEPISRDAFATAVARVLPAIDEVAGELGPPTEFEALTAAAITELAARDVDVAVIEVGMGGRLDATNVLDLGVAAITNVQHDHERHLGSTLAQIGTEKAAIVKPGNLAVTGASGRGLRPIVARCATVEAPLRRAGPGQHYRVVLRDAGWEGIEVDAETPDDELRGLRIGLLGGHQAQNAAVALALLDALREDGSRRGAELEVTEAVLRRGLADVRWPGRLELLDGSLLGVGGVLLDGAHNPAGAAALVAALGELGLRRPSLVFGAMRSKRVHGVLRAMSALDPRPVFTSVADPGAMPASSLLRIWRRVAPHGDAGSTADSPIDALRMAAGTRRGDAPVLVAGSLYLVGAVRGLLTGEVDE